MDLYSCTKVCSSNSFSSSSSTFVGHQDQYEEKKEKPHLSTLHRVRSLPLKSLNKKPIAPLPPIPPKVYTVEVVNFRQVVQLLTTAPEFQSHSSSTSGSGHLQEVPPLLRGVSTTSLSSNSNIGGQWREFLPPSSTVVISIDDDSDESIIEADEKDIEPQIPTDSTIFGACDTSPQHVLPSYFAWCSSLLLSPDALTSLDSSTVL